MHNSVGLATRERFYVKIPTSVPIKTKPMKRTQEPGINNHRLMKAPWLTFAFLILFLVWATTGSGEESSMMIRPPQFTTPPSGQTVNERFDITLDDDPPAHCVSLVHNQATLLIYAW